MSKLTKFLETHGTFLEKKPSGSSYYMLGDQKVRVSDHLSGGYFPNSLNILLPQGTNKQYVLMFLDRIYVHNSFTSLRVFLEHLLLISNAYAHRLKVTERAKQRKISEIAQDSNKRVIAAEKVAQELRKELLVKKPESAFGEDILKSLTKGQLNTVISFVKQNKEFPPKAKK